MMSDPRAGREKVLDDAGAMRRFLVKLRSKRGLALRDVFIVARDEHCARARVEQMYRLSEITTICPSATDARYALALTAKRESA